jgi:ribose/xylose/arabinose/galactoside ABC-type transport system permease subunit
MQEMKAEQREVSGEVAASSILPAHGNGSGEHLVGAAALYRTVARRAVTAFGRRLEFGSSAIFFVLLLVVFMAISPNIWLSSRIYTACATTAPQTIFLAVALVFVIISGEIDLSFASVVTLSSYLFALTATHGVPVILAVAIAVAAAVCAELLAGVIVAYGGMSSFVVTLGLYYLWDGFVNVLANGNGIPVATLEKSVVARVYTGSLGTIPAQMLWAIGFTAVAVPLLGRRSFGLRALAVGDNREASREQGINVKRVKLGAFAFVGLASGAVGVMLCLVNTNFYPASGDDLLLPALAAVFIGGTAITGGAGTVMGAFMGSLSITIIGTGIVTSGLSGFYTQFVFGIIIVLSVAVLRFTSGARRTSIL